MNTQNQDRELEAMLADTTPGLDDDFTERVMAALPPRRSSRTRVAIVTLAGLLGVGLAFGFAEDPGALLDRVLGIVDLIALVPRLGQAALTAHGSHALLIWGAFALLASGAALAAGRAD